VGRSFTEASNRCVLVLVYYKRLIIAFVNNNIALFLEDHREPYRQPPPSSRRPPSPRHSRARSRSRTRSPSPRQRITLGNHSITPHSPSKLMTRDSRSASPPSRKRTATPPRHRLPPRSRSPSVIKVEEDIVNREPEISPSTAEPPREKGPVIKQEESSMLSPTPPPSIPSPSAARAPFKSDSIPTGPRIRAPVKPETTPSSLPTGPAPRYTEKEKGKQREQPPSSEGDVKMRSRSPSPPREPRARPSIRGHSPPRGPRNAPRGPGWAKTPTTPTSPASFHLPTKPGWNSRNHITGQFSQPGQSPFAKPTEPEIVLPHIEKYKPKQSLEIDGLEKEVRCVSFSSSCL
jgi:hypothetical protein